MRCTGALHGKLFSVASDEWWQQKLTQLCLKKSPTKNIFSRNHQRNPKFSAFLDASLFQIPHGTWWGEKDLGGKRHIKTLVVPVGCMKGRSVSCWAPAFQRWRRRAKLRSFGNCGTFGVLTFSWGGKSKRKKEQEKSLQEIGTQ